MSEYNWWQHEDEVWGYESADYSDEWYYLERDKEGEEFWYWTEEYNGNVTVSTRIPEVTTLEEAKQFIEVLVRMS